MDLIWKPVVHSASSVDIPQVTVSCDATALEGWKAANRPWINSKRMDCSVWGPYERLADGGRFVLPFEGEAARRRFAELHTALLLQREGFFCWGSAQLFKYRRDERALKGGSGLKGRKIDTTEEIRSRVRPWRWPSEIQPTLDFQPRNPDIIAYSEDRNEWRFCEVKGPGERIDPNQLNALAVLHLLTGAPVAVVRVVLGAGAITSLRPTEIPYRKGAQLDWIHRRLRKRAS